MQETYCCGCDCHLWLLFRSLLGLVPNLPSVAMSVLHVGASIPSHHSLQFLLQGSLANLVFVNGRLEATDRIVLILHTFHHREHLALESL